MYLTGHGIDADLEVAVFAAARRFFALPDRLEIVNTNSPHFRGYTRLGHEHTNGMSDRRDRSISAPSAKAPDVAPDAPPWLRLRGPNMWPPAVPRDARFVVAWMDQMALLGDAVLRALAIGLEQTPDLFETVVKPDPETLVKIIRYPAPDNIGDPDQGVGAHHDSGLITFIMQDDVGGLQVLRGDTFVDAVAMPTVVHPQPR